MKVAEVEPTASSGAIIFTSVESRGIIVNKIFIREHIWQDIVIPLAQLIDKWVITTVQSSNPVLAEWCLFWSE